VQQHYRNHNTCFRLSLFSDISLSQGSVATALRYGEIFKNYFIANFLVNLSVQEFGNWLTCGEVTDKSVVFCIFLVYSVREIITIGSHVVCRLALIVIIFIIPFLQKCSINPIQSNTIKTKSTGDAANMFVTDNSLSSKTPT